VREDNDLKVTIRHDDYRIGLFGVLFLVLLVCAFWKWILLGVGVVWAVLTVLFLAGWWRAEMRGRAEEQAALSRRADEQHRWVFQGNPKGYFGHDWSYDDEGHKP